MSRHVLDELVGNQYYSELQRWLSIVKVGDGFGWKSMQDDEIRRELHSSGKTFHTQDKGYYHPIHRHHAYCLVYYDVTDKELVTYIRRFLRHPQFNTHAKRMGNVVRVTTQYIEVWSLKSENREIIEWN
jgi:hypothetical protein